MLRFRIEKILLFSRLEPQWGAIILSLLLFFYFFSWNIQVQSFKTPLQVEICSNQGKYYCKSDNSKKVTDRRLDSWIRNQNNTLQINPVGYY